ncbi:MAG: U32 family peptidase [Deltaproteobacteria bacterium]|nr:U32 family peptidase [Deltaproteobacteria bacterium]
MVKRADTPELLAPAGDDECLRAAVNAGADAVYFGLRDGFNARARAANFAVEDLPRTFDYLHARGVRGFVTFNTLVFDSELALAERTLAAIARAGADAIIVQDLGVAKLAHEVCPALHLHASTQMTVSSAEGARIAQGLGVTRVVVPRELSITEITKLAAGTDVELECFVHGALCMSWSGQCLTSEALEARSANRGQCAQSCRLPYDLFVDGARRDLHDLKYLLSPKDLAAYDLLPELLAAGICSFKLEGRMKGKEYVTNTVEKYRRALDHAIDANVRGLDKDDERELRLTFSRGFGPGFLKGSHHQTLVHGKYPGHRGVEVGRVDRVEEARGYVWVTLVEGAPALSPGDRVLFDQQRPEEDEPRGSLFGVDLLAGGKAKLVFGGEEAGRRGSGADLDRVRPGDVVYKARDIALARKLKKIAETERRIAVDVRVTGSIGRPLVAEAEDALGRSAKSESQTPLDAARTRPLERALVEEKLCAFGETRFALRRLDLAIDGAVAIAPSELKRMRRELTDALVEQAIAAPARTIVEAAPPKRVTAGVERSRPVLVPLLRTLEQVAQAIALKDALALEDVELDFMELVGLGEAVERVRAAGLSVIIATPRVQKPGEEGYDRRFANLQPDGILARHLGALEHFLHADRGVRVHGDFSLNATNVRTAAALLELGLTTLTPAYDLDATQLLALVDGVRPDRLEVTIHQHLPLYHTEHCVYAHTLSKGKDFKDCGRPCEAHLIHLQDTQGLAHPVIVDVGCRNTVFNAKAQSAALVLQKLLVANVARYRVELVREDAAETALVLTTYRALLDGKLDARAAVRSVGAIEKYGVSSGTLQVLAG